MFFLEEPDMGKDMSKKKQTAVNVQEFGADGAWSEVESRDEQSGHSVPLFCLVKRVPVYYSLSR